MAQCHLLVRQNLILFIVLKSAKCGKRSYTENQTETEKYYVMNRYIWMVHSVNLKMIFCPANLSHLIIKLTVDQLRDKIKTKDVKIIMDFSEIDLNGQFL